MNSQILRAIEARRADIAAQAEALHAEDAELAVAERALRRLLQNDLKSSFRPSESAPARSEAAAPRRGRTPKFGAKSQRELVLEALSEAKETWLDTATILSSVKATAGIALPKKTISPLLSVMRREGVILRKGRTVALANRVSPLKPRARSHAAA